MKLAKSQSGFTPVHVLLLLVIVSIIGFAGWKVYEVKKESSSTAESGTSNSTTSAPNKSKVAKEKYSGQFVPYEHTLYTLYYPQTAVLSSDDYGDGGEVNGDTVEVVAIYQENTKHLTVMRTAVEYRVGSQNSLSKNVGTAQELATKSHAVNKASTNENYKVEVSELKETKIGNVKAYTFDVHMGFSTGYDTAHTGSGFLLNGADYLSVYFVQASGGDVIRFVMDKDHPVSQQMVSQIKIK